MISNVTSLTKLTFMPNKLGDFKSYFFGIVIRLLAGLLIFKYSMDHLLKYFILIFFMNF